LPHPVDQNDSVTRLIHWRGNWEVSGSNDPRKYTWGQTWYFDRPVSYNMIRAFDCI